ncbi:hypothetical protein [Catenulispora sp. GAS73]|uniref:hypothetical protein n=1 Tax=Catenulispora sp. GAS73 TaxID=3156269 RepID=UPI0035132FE7
MTDDAEALVNDRFWDGPRYRVRTEAFEVSFLPGDGKDVEAACNIDAFVDLTDGSRRSATVFTLAEVERLLNRWATIGHQAHGRSSMPHASLLLIGNDFHMLFERRIENGFHHR